MSADDARHSISRVGGLKERMAALQGKGAFGAPVDPNTSKAPPLPSEQGKARVWRNVVDLPPPPATTATKDEYNIDATAVPNSDDTAKGENVDGDSEPKTEEDLERERRAAIAARMAKLGGARVRSSTFTLIYANYQSTGRNGPAHLRQEARHPSETQIYSQG